MELDDLKRLWEEQNQKLDANIQLSARLLNRSALDKAEPALRRLFRWLWIELAINLVVASWVGSFLARHLQEPRFLVPAAALHLSVIALIIAGVRQLVAINSVDYGAPVLAIQNRLESLRVERIRATMWTLLVAPLLWTPLLIVTLKGLFGLDAYAALGPGFLTANLLFGLLLIALALWISERYAGRMGRIPWVQRLMRDIAGHNLTAAERFLASLRELETDDNRA